MSQDIVGNFEGYQILDAIIGNTGFVGSHLIEKHDFHAQFNSSNINEALGQSYSTVVCAAAPGSMFEANNFPERDKDRVDQLIKQISQIKAERLILISSVAVLADLAGKDDELTSHFQTELAYGRHRRALEKFCEENFQSCLILRLPALFGHGLKKNFIFDLLNPVPSMLNEKSYNDLIEIFPTPMIQALVKVYAWSDDMKMFIANRDALRNLEEKVSLETALTEAGYSSVQFTNPNTNFQYYNIENLWTDIGVAQANQINVLHLATEPLDASQIHLELTGQPMPRTRARVHHENMYSNYGELWGESGQYLVRGDATLTQLKEFFRTEKEIR